MTFLKTVLIILLVYYLLKIVAKWFAPKIFSYAAKKTEAHFRGKFEGFANQQRGEEEAQNDPIINSKKNPKSNANKKVGEYIDFEEVD